MIYINTDENREDFPDTFTPNTERSEEEFREWWNVPFIVKRGGSFEVHCLNGGAWDRPTIIGFDFDEEWGKALFNSVTMSARSAG